VVIDACPTVVTHGGIASGGVATTPYVADELVVTKKIYDLNTNRDGDNFLDRVSTQFGMGPAPEELKARAEAARLAKVRKERDFLLRANPHLFKQYGASRNLDQLNAALGEKSMPLNAGGRFVPRPTWIAPHPATVML